MKVVGLVGVVTLAYWEAIFRGFGTFSSPFPRHVFMSTGLFGLLLHPHIRSFSFAWGSKNDTAAAHVNLK